MTNSVSLILLSVSRGHPESRRTREKSSMGKKKKITFVNVFFFVLGDQSINSQEV